MLPMLAKHRLRIKVPLRHNVTYVLGIHISFVAVYISKCLVYTNIFLDVLA